MDVLDINLHLCQIVIGPSFIFFLVHVFISVAGRNHSQTNLGGRDSVTFILGFNFRFLICGHS